MPELAYFARYLIAVVAKSQINPAKFVQPAGILERGQQHAVRRSHQALDTLPLDGGRAQPAPHLCAVHVHSVLQRQEQLGRRDQHSEETYCA
jgi:hypothetical protein